MNRFNWKSATLFTIASMATAVVIQACGSDNGAVAQTTAVAPAPDPIEGTFQSDVTIRDCTTGATTTTFRGLTAFHQGGTATSDNNTPPSGKGVAIGTWKKGASGTYNASFRFFIVLPTTAIGQQRFQRAITLSADGNTLTSSISGQLFDPAGNVLATICGVETGVRYS